jgi:hypothetical protein
MTTKKKGGLPRPVPRKVPVERVLTDEVTFQPRGGGLNEAHVSTLLDVLKQGSEFDPLALWEDPVTGKLTVADGHHRLEAHRRHGKARHIHALVYRCDARTALLIPIQDNAKARLPLTYDDRANWAWRLSSLSVSLWSILDNKPLDIALKTLQHQSLRLSGGEGGIRTHGRRKPTTVFETATIDHSVTSPRLRGRLCGGVDSRASGNAQGAFARI